MEYEQNIEELPPRKQNKYKKKRQIKYVSSLSLIATAFLYIISSIILFSSIYYIVKQGELALTQSRETYILLLLLTVVFFIFFGTQFTLHYLYKTFFFEKNRGKVLFSILMWMFFIPIQIYGLFFIYLTNFGLVYFSILSSFIIIQFIYSSFIYILFLFTPTIFPGTSQKTANSWHIRQE